jgi:pimeloyl-ACP methyl ester carboxylesterase
MNFENHTFTHHHLTLNYYTAGHGPPLVFLHGGGVDSLTYSKLLKLLAEQYRIIAIDLPGFGKSSAPPTRWNYHQYAQHLNHLITDLKLKHITLLGHSFGGAVALQLAAIQPQIKHLVIIDGAILPISCSLPLFFFRFSVTKTLTDLRLYRNLPLLIHAGRAFTLGTSRHLSKLPQMLPTIVHCLRHPAPIPKNLAVKTIVLWADQDELFPATWAAQIAQQIPNAKHHHLPGNHDWILFQPNLILPYLN